MTSIFMRHNRFMKRQGRFLTWLIIFSFFFHAGCAHVTPVLSDTERQKLGSIGVVTAGYSPEFEVQKPAKGGFASFGRGVARGAAKGFSAPFSGGSGSDGGSGAGVVAIFMLGVAVVCGTVGGLVGGVSGAVKALPASEVEAAEAALEKAIKQQNAQEKLRDHVLHLSKYWPRYKIAPLPENGPQLPDEKKSYSSLSGKGVDTVLEIAVRNFGLTGNWEVNPILQFFMTASARLVRVKDGTELYSYTFTYVSSTHSFTEWANAESKLFYEKMDNAYDSLSSQIVNNLFVMTTPERQREVGPEQKVNGDKPIWQ